MSTYTLVSVCTGGEHITLKRDDGEIVLTTRTELFGPLREALKDADVVRDLIKGKTEPEAMAALAVGVSTAAADAGVGL